LLSFLSILELLNYLPVSKHWNAWIKRAWRPPHGRFLCLEQFWARLGAPGTDSTPFVSLLSQMDGVEHISLAYCSGLTDAIAEQLFDVLAGTAERAGRVTSLNLFYCYQLSEKTICGLADRFPGLQDLNIGRVPKVTLSALEVLGSKLKHLRKLNLICNLNLNEDAMALFDIDVKFSALIELDIQDTSMALQKYVDELKNTRPGLTIKGPEIVRTDPTKKQKAANSPTS